jgi:FNIP Repeat
LVILWQCYSHPIQLFLQQSSGIPTKYPHPSYVWTQIQQEDQTLPSSLLHISFGTKFNQPLQCLPSSLLSLTLGEHYQLSFTVPPSLIRLVYPENSHSLVTNLKLPSTLQYYSASSQVSQPLPASLTTIIFRRGFNDEIQCDYPPNLTHLYFGPSFNKPLIVPLPSSLEVLSFGPAFCKPIIKIPPSYYNSLWARHSNIP